MSPNDTWPRYLIVVIGAGVAMPLACDEGDERVADVSVLGGAAGAAGAEEEAKGGGGGDGPAEPGDSAGAGGVASTSGPDCAPGEYRLEAQHGEGYSCLECPEGMYSFETNSVACLDAFGQCPWTDRGDAIS